MPRGERLVVKVFDYDVLTSNELLGTVDIDLYDEVQMIPGGDVTKTWELLNVPKSNWMNVGGSKGADPAAKPSITMRIQWIPFKYT